MLFLYVCGDDELAYLCLYSFQLLLGSIQSTKSQNAPTRTDLTSKHDPFPFSIRVPRPFTGQEQFKNIPRFQNKQYFLICIEKYC